MGHNESKLPRPDPQMDFFLLAFQPPDRLKVVLADEYTIDNVRQSCHQAWPLGLQADTRCNDGSYKIRFVGTPFFVQHTASKANIANAKLLILKILSSLYEFGWQLVMASELTKDSEASTCFFRRYSLMVDSPLRSVKKKNTTSTSRKSRLFCLALHSYDKLQLINGSDSVKQLFQEIAQQKYAPGIEEQIQFGAQFFELKLRGRPWWNDIDVGNDVNGPLEARKLLLQLIRGFRKLGYNIYGVANIGDSSHCIYFIQNTNDFTDNEDDDRFCMISLCDDDGLLLIDADETVVNAMKVAVTNAWPGGVYHEELQSKSGEKVSRFKIKGRPWRSTGPDTVSNRRFISNLFRTLLANGWRVEQSLEISQQSIGGKSTSFVLRSCDRQNLPHACINLSDPNKIRIIGDGSWVTRHQSATSLSGSQRLPDRCSSIDATTSSSPRKQRGDTSDTRRRHSSSSKRRLTKSARYEAVSVPNVPAAEPVIAPRLLVTPPSDEHLANSSSPSVPEAYLELIQLVRSGIERSWPYGIDREGDYYGSREFRLQGCPWAAANISGGGASNRPLVARAMMCYILKSVTDAGWRAYASADISSSKLYPLNPVKGVVSASKSNTAMEVHPLAPATSDVHSWFLVYHGAANND